VVNRGDAHGPKVDLQLRQVPGLRDAPDGLDGDMLPLDFPSASQQEVVI
jgi:hypothetical protein